MSVPVSLVTLGETLVEPGTEAGAEALPLDSRPSSLGVLRLKAGDGGAFECLGPVDVSVRGPG